MSIENGAYLSPIQASSVVDSVVSRLVSAIMSGELKPGMKIPTAMSFFAMDFPLKFYLRRYTELCFKRKALIMI